LCFIADDFSLISRVSYRWMCVSAFGDSGDSRLSVELPFCSFGRLPRECAWSLFDSLFRAGVDALNRPWNRSNLRVGIRTQSELLAHRILEWRSTAPDRGLCVFWDVFTEIDLYSRFRRHNHWLSIFAYCHSGDSGFPRQSAFPGLRRFPVGL
jgi:hypothetical protein